MSPTRIIVCRILTAAPRSHFDHLEVFLARPALGTGPVGRDILPARARRDAFLGQPGRFVVDESAYETHVRLENLRFRGGHADFRFELESNSIQSFPRDQTRGCASLP